MKIHTDIKQGSDEWMALRASKLCASEVDAILTPKFKVKDGKAVETLVARKLVERWTGQPILDEDWLSESVERGKILENDAKPAFQIFTEKPIHNVGFIESDDGVCGCSPDAMGDGFGVEIKCPGMPNHVKWCLAGQIPDEYLPQIHFSMFVSGLDTWHFMSYQYRMSGVPLILEARRSDEFQEAIIQAVDLFSNKMVTGWRRLLELNGGEPKRGPTVDEIRAQDENQDNIP